MDHGREGLSALGGDFYGAKGMRTDLQSHFGVSNVVHFADISQGHFHSKVPMHFFENRGHMDPLDEDIGDDFQTDRTGDTTVRIIIVRNMQGGLLRESVGYANFHEMRLFFCSGINRIERSEGVIMMSDLLTIDENIRSVADAFENEAKVTADLKFMAVYSGTSIVAKTGIGFPTTGD